MKKLDQSTVFIVGLGQIGGSLGIDLVKKRLVAEVIGFDHDKTITRTAKKRKIVDSYVATLKEGLNLADLVILAIPIRAIIALLPSLVHSLPKDRDIGVLDVASTKVAILNAVSKTKAPLNYVGGHPITGTERSGLEAVKPGRFTNTAFILVPHKQTQKKWLNTMKKLVVGLGAKPILMKARQHDRLIALTSNLPYLLSLALLDLAIKYGKIDSKTWDLVGGSFKSATRVAASSLDLTIDMLLTNRRQIPKVIDEMMAELSLLKGMVEGEFEPHLQTIVKKVQKTARAVQRSNN